MSIFNGGTTAGNFYHIPSLDIFKKWDRVMFGSSGKTLFFFFIFVIFKDSESFDSVTVTETKL